MDRPVELVLHHRKKPSGGLGCQFVVDRLGLDVCDLLVEFALAAPDLPNALELLLEVLLAEDRAIVLQPLVIHREALDCEGFEDAGSPLPALDRPLGVDFVPNGDDGRKVVVLGVGYFAVCGSYLKFRITEPAFNSASSKTFLRWWLMVWVSTA